MTEEFEELGRLIDELDNLAHGLSLPVPNNIHVMALRSAIPETVVKLKSCFVSITKTNPWE